MSNSVLIIAGMHRSGTSVISQWLNRCGLNLGEILLGADIGNVEGHFEDVDFIRFHEDTLSANNLPKTGLTDNVVHDLSGYEREKLKTIVHFKNKMHKQWGWKDPRTCLFLDHYRNYIPGAYFLNIIRDYKSSVSSLVIRDFKHYEGKYLSRKWFSKMIWKNFRRKRKLKKFYTDLTENYLNVWVTYNQEMLNNIKSLNEEKYLVVDYCRLCENDKNIFDQLKNDWNFNLRYFDFKKIYREDLISQVVDIDSYINDKVLLQKARELENELKKLCLQPKHSENQFKGSPLINNN